MMDVKRVISTIERNHIKKNLKNGVRIDERGLWEFRDIEVDTDVVAAAEGSSDVRIGDTRIMTGLKYDIGTPYPDLPDEGVCTVMAELIPLASPLFERGPPDEQSIELARVVDRGIRHADCIQTKNLCIKEKEAVYILFLDMYVINYSGNLIDCGGIGGILALISAQLPEGKWNEETEEAEWTGNYIKTEDLVNELPIAVTFGKIDDMVFVDPSLPEELVADGTVTISCTEESITSIQKSGPATFTLDEIRELGNKSMEISKNLRNQLDPWQYKSEI